MQFFLLMHSNKKFEKKKSEHNKRIIVRKRSLKRQKPNVYYNEEHTIAQLSYAVSDVTYARNVSFLTLCGGQFTFSTQLLTLNYLLFSSIVSLILL